MPDSEHRDPAELRGLKEMCFSAVRKHFDALGTGAVLELPTPLMKDLLPHLTICQLDELQPVLNQKGISTHSEWVRVLQDMYGPNHAIDLHSEEEAKHEVMRILFPLVFYGFTNSYVKRNIRHLSSPAFLWAAAKCIQHFLLVTSLHKPLHSLTAEHWPLLNLLEKRIKSVGVSQPIDLSKRTTQSGLYVLHRLLDHGVATKLVVHVQCPIVLAWLLHKRGSQHVNPELKTLMQCRKASCVSGPAAVRTDESSCSPGLEAGDDQDHVIPCKTSRLDLVSVVEEESGEENSIVDPQVLCRSFTPCADLRAAACPWGKITCLKITQCGPDCLEVLYSALPTFYCLQSLSLHSTLTFRYSDVLGLTRALKQLSDSSCSSLTELCVSILPNTNLLEVLLDSSPTVTSLHVEIHTVVFEPRVQPPHPRTAESDMPAVLLLEKLKVKVAEVQTDLHFLTSVLRRSPHLTSLHVAGMRLPSGSSHSQLLSTFSVSNPCLKTLHLEDMKLCDCLPDVLKLLGNCKLEELHLNDCRLLEKCADKEETLQQLVDALKTLASLHTLSLAQNRLAKHVCVLAQLFSGSSPSSVKRLDISSNFIQPAELLEFAERLEKHRPPHRLTLDLRRNPGDRDPDMWNAAVKRLGSFSVLLVEGWKSTDTMVDHISNM